MAKMETYTKRGGSSVVDGEGLFNSGNFRKTRYCSINCPDSSALNLSGVGIVRV